MQPTPWLVVFQLLAVSIPLTLAVGAALVTERRPLRTASRTLSFVAAISVVVACGVVVSPHADRTIGLPPALDVSGGVRLDATTALMLALISVIGLAIARYSASYLRGEPGLARYARSLLATLAAVTLLVVANDLVVITVAWLGTSLALHQLLTHYGDRRQALVAAHKKFLVSRLADLCLVGGVALVATSAGTVDLSELGAWASAQPELPPLSALAAVLFAIGACLKSAQLPFHGWLIQVMEAPTPVSALLHAGVVNLGGFLMIRLSPLMVRSDAAQLLLVVVGTSTAVVAALVMRTRVSVKVALAWSTCAQMGFMLAECGLGAHHLALLHLIAHSIYKANAFLASGSAVEEWRIASLVSRRAPPSLARMVLGSLLTVGLVATATVVARVLVTAPGGDLAPSPVAIVIGLAVSTLVVSGMGRGPRALVDACVRSAVVAGGYFALDHAFSHWLVGGTTPGTTTPTWSLGWFLFVGAFALLLGVELVLRAQPDGRVARALHPVLFAGLHLDETFTRLTFRLWPPALPPTPKPSVATPETLEA